MINAQHAHIYRIHTLHFIFGEIFFPKILSIQPLSIDTDRQTKVLICGFVVLLCCRSIVMLMYCHIVVLSYCCIVVLSYCCIVCHCVVVLLCCRVVMLSCCYVVGCTYMIYLPTSYSTWKTTPGSSIDPPPPPPPMTMDDKWAYLFLFFACTYCEVVHVVQKPRSGRHTNEQLRNKYNNHRSTVKNWLEWELTHIDTTWEPYEKM